MESAGVYDLPELVIPEGSCLAYRIGESDLSATARIYKTIFSPANRHPFCLVVSTGATDSNALTDLVLTCSFHQNYHKVDFGIPVLLFESAHTDYESTLSIFRNEFIQQGYDEVECVVIGKHDAYSWPERGKRGFRSDLNGKDPKELSRIYDLAFDSTAATDLSFFLDVKTPSALREGIKSLLEADEQAEQRHPGTYALLRTIRLHLETQRELRFSIGLLQQRLASQFSYHSHFYPAESHVGRQITEITEFYKYEYEILPLWFKRLGHIIKVLMGKRTFKSLFSDRVKKYKV